MDLVPYSDDDLALTRALRSDPAVMKELGGPHTEAEILDAHRRGVATVARGDWWFKIVPDPGGAPVGTIGVWESEWKGAKVHEAGVSNLPSNALCRRFGFTMTEEASPVDYAGRTLRCNHWELELP